MTQLNCAITPLCYHIPVTKPPPTMNKTPLEEPRPIRIRVVRIINNKYMFCSCGKSGRSRSPCTHVFAVVKKRDKIMYAVRHLIAYQHYYLRDQHNVDNKRITNAFNILIEQEKQREEEEQILIEGIMSRTNHPIGPFPYLGDGTSMADYRFAAKVVEYKQQGIIALRNEALPWNEVKENNKNQAHDDFAFIGGCDDCVMSPDMDVQVHYSQKGQEALSQTIALTQESQVEANSKTNNTKESLYQWMMGIVKDLTNLGESDPEETKYLKEQMNEVHLKMVERSVEKKRKIGKVTPDKGEGYFFPETGKETKRVSKRYKQSYEK